MLHSTKIKIKISPFTNDTLISLAFIMFFCYDFITSILMKVGLSSGFSSCLVLVLTYGLVIFSCYLSSRYVIKDFIILFICILVFFGLTYVLNPENQYWYTRERYGYWDYVLKPSNGIYAYLFIRLGGSPKSIVGNLKKCGWIMYVYYGAQLLTALRRGYWISIGSKGQTVHIAYNLSFGYAVLFFTVVFLYEAMTKKRVLDIIGAAIGIMMVVLGGSRGSLLCIVVFVFLMELDYFKKSKKKFRIILSVGILLLLLFVFSTEIIEFILFLMEKFNISSRTITMLLEGSISDDNGRDVIWAAAIQMIRSNLLGYGAMGSRRVISSYHIAGHCHNIALEMLVDFGVLVGGLILLFLVKNIICILMDDRYKEWRGVFIIFLANSCELLLSACFWNVGAFWACCAVGYMAIKTAKKNKIQKRRIKFI